MLRYSIEISEDEAVILFEFFERFDETGKLTFAHPSEYVVFQKIAGQICKTTSAMFKPNYLELLELARTRIADGFEGNVPGLDE